MIRRRAPLAVCLALVGCVLFAKPASADIIGLNAPLSGTGAAGNLLDLTVSFDLNGSSATNLVGLELYLAFTGMTPVAGSWTPGSVFTGFEPDILTTDGLCSDLGCNDPAGSLPGYYLSLLSVFAPSEPGGPGSLFTMQFAVEPLTQWTLNLFGDSLSGLLWDPPPQDCDPADASCDPDPAVAPIPFVVVRSTDIVPPGIARINVDVPAFNPDPDPGPGTDPTPVPEPGSLLLLGSGLVAGIAHLRRQTRSLAA